MRADVVPTGILADDAGVGFPLARVHEMTSRLFEAQEGSQVRNGGNEGEPTLNVGYR